MVDQSESTPRLIESRADRVILKFKRASGAVKTILIRSVRVFDNFMDLARVPIEGVGSVKPIPLSPSLSTRAPLSGLLLQTRTSLYGSGVISP